MVCSPEQLAANRRNSKRSTGPKTTQGKANSRRNGLKHGLTGAGVVIADEDSEAVEERFAAFEADLKPANAVARFLVERAALLSVRLERSAREEAARTTLDMLEAEEFEEDARAEEFRRLTTGFDAHPAESVRKLRRSEEGIDWLLGAWRKARVELLDRATDRWRFETLVRLLGQQPEHAPFPRIRALSYARDGSFRLLEPTDWPDLEADARRDAASAELLTIVDRGIADLEAARTNLDRDRIAQARAGAAGRALFNPAKDACLARKYEAANERNFYKALAQVEAINAAAEEAGEPARVEATTEHEETCDEMASSFPARSDLRSPIDRASGWDRSADEGGREMAGRRSSAGKTAVLTDH